KQLEAGEPPRYLLATIQALIQPVPSPAELAQNRRVLRVHEPIDPDELAAWLVERGFRRTDAVELPGEFSRRGGILDVFSADADTPYRLEFFGDEIESIRQFSPHNQRSLRQLQTVELLGAAVQQPDIEANGAPSAIASTGHFCDYLPADAWTILVEPADLQEQGKHYLERVADPRG